MWMRGRGPREEGHNLQLKLILLFKFRQIEVEVVHGGVLLAVLPVILRQVGHHLPQPEISPPHSRPLHHGEDVSDVDQVALRVFVHFKEPVLQTPLARTNPNDVAPLPHLLASRGR